MATYYFFLEMKHIVSAGLTCFTEDVSGSGSARRIRQAPLKVKATVS